jgi:hypothetical protein
MTRYGIFLLLVLAFRCVPACAQIPVNNSIDPTDTLLNDAVRFLSKYIGEFRPGRYPDFTKYWPEADCKAFRHPDQMMNAIDPEIPTYMLGTPMILLARPEGQVIHLKTMFYHIDSSGGMLVSCITNHYINRAKEGTMKFINPMFMVSDEWRSQKTRNVTYFYPSYHSFSKKKAAFLAKNIAALEKEWNLPPLAIRYYFADTKEEIEHFRGFDFTIAMGNRDKPSGMSDGVDNIVYCGGWGENYFHEVVHLYLNRLFPGSPLTEGLAVMYGGSLGHMLPWHITRLSSYLQAHPEIDLNNPHDFYYLDNYTNPYSTLLGMLCDAAYKKEGVAGLKRIMRYPTLSDLMLREYHLKKGEWDTFLRDMASQYKLSE